MNPACNYSMFAFELQAAFVHGQVQAMLKWTLWECTCVQVMSTYCTSHECILEFQQNTYPRHQHSLICKHLHKCRLHHNSFIKRCHGILIAQCCSRSLITKFDDAVSLNWLASLSHGAALHVYCLAIRICTHLCHHLAIEAKHCDNQNVVQSILPWKLPAKASQQASCVSQGVMDLLLVLQYYTC